MNQSFISYIKDTFPVLINPDWRLKQNISKELTIAFELGEPYDNGTDERINQVMNRVTSLFEYLFKPSDMLYIMVKDYEIETDVMFGNPTPHYIYDLLCNHAIKEKRMYENDQDYDEAKQLINIKINYKLSIASSPRNNFPYKDIFQGIAHHEQGRIPSIIQAITFVGKEKDIIFHMYDDRGCAISSNSIEKLRGVYDNFQQWIVDYRREKVDLQFKEK